MNIYITSSYHTYGLMAKSKYGRKFSVLRTTAIIVVLAVAISIVAAFVSYRPPIAANAENCGTVDIHFTPYSSNSTQVENCFFSAYTGAYNATMSLHYMGVDTGSTDNLTVIHSVDNTIIYDVAKSFVNVGGTKTALYVCGRMAPYFDNSTKIGGFLVSQCTANYTVFIPSTQVV